jgi:hypothetical protein
MAHVKFGGRTPAEDLHNDPERSPVPVHLDDLALETLEGSVGHHDAIAGNEGFAVVVSPRRRRGGRKRWRGKENLSGK